jgi:hypothetical protein
MSTQNRKKVLLGFGALAVVVVVALAIWAPSFRNEDASGAIGAVQKHRAPQITRQDVVLGSEATRQRQNVLYGDFLKDSAKLQSVSALVAARNHKEAASRMKENEIELQQRYLQRAEEALAAAKAMNREVANAELANEIDAAAALAAKGQQLSEQDMPQLNVKLAHIAEVLNKASAGARGMRAARTPLADAVAEVQSHNLAAARGNFELAQRELKDQELANLGVEAEYLAAISLELQALNQAEELFARVNARGSQAETEAANILNVAAANLESRAAKNLTEQLNEEVQMAAALRNAEEGFAFARQQGSSQAAMAKTAQNRELAEAEQAFMACKALFASTAASHMQFELASVEQYLNSQTQAQARAGSAELAHMLSDLEAQLAGNSALAAVMQNEEQLAAKAAELGGRARPVRTRQSSSRRRPF